MGFGLALDQGVEPGQGVRDEGLGLAPVGGADTFGLSRRTRPDEEEARGQPVIDLALEQLRHQIRLNPTEERDGERRDHQRFIAEFAPVDGQALGVIGLEPEAAIIATALSIPGQRGQPGGHLRHPAE
ncbi:MAG: hypothetical protein MZV64_10160 [Ignavibacteriales bacterium]|nr:hypothetical protein [Ignavibacteriales bacterium]